MKCYVYILFTHNGRPFYIGKGSKNRWLSHERLAGTDDQSVKSRIIRSMWRHGWKTIPKVKVREGLTHEEANETEIVLIASIGRRPYGPLVNLTDGGDGLINPSKETRARIGTAHRVRKHGPCSEETKAKISKSNSGKVRTPDQRERLSKALSGIVRSEDFKSRVSATMKGRPSNNPAGPPRSATLKSAESNRGKKRPANVVEKMRIAGLNQSLEKREKLSLAAKRQWAAFWLKQDEERGQKV